MLHEGSIQTLSKQGVGSTTVSDNAAAADVRGKPCARSGTLETPPFRWGYRRSETVAGALLSDEFRCQGQHETGLR